MDKCPICRERHDAARGLSYDGFGINDCSIYRNRVATFNREVPDEIRKGIVRACNNHEELLGALRNLISLIEQFKMEELRHQPLTAYYAALDAVAKAEAGEGLRHE